MTGFNQPIKTQHTLPLEADQPIKPGFTTSQLINTSDIHLPLPTVQPRRRISFSQLTKPSSAPAADKSSRNFRSPNRSSSQKSYADTYSIGTSAVASTRLFNNGSDLGYEQEGYESQAYDKIRYSNRAVEAAFNRAINHRTVSSNRLRIGLLTNDVTPRVQLQVRFFHQSMLH